MKSAVRLLSLSYQCHTRRVLSSQFCVSKRASLTSSSAMIQHQPELIVARVSSHMDAFIIDSKCSQDLTLTCHPESSPTRSTNVVVKQYNNWTTTSSWMRYLLGSYEYWKRKEQYKGRDREELGAKLTIPFWPERMWDCRGYETLSGGDSIFKRIVSCRNLHHSLKQSKVEISTLCEQCWQIERPRLLTDFMSRVFSK